jgi:hypothetical protein
VSWERGASSALPWRGLFIPRNKASGRGLSGGRTAPIVGAGYRTKQKAPLAQRGLFQASRKHMSADIFFKAAYVFAMIGYGVLTYLSIFHDFP